MFTKLFQLVILFLVIFDPLASLSVFIVATKEMDDKTRIKTAMLSVGVAMAISYVFLIFGQNVVIFFGSNMSDFKTASGVILGVLGIKMVLGEVSDKNKIDSNSSQAIAALIATPLLTGPAAITTIIISVNDNEFGFIITGLAITIVLLLTSVIFLASSKIQRFINQTFIKVLTTIMGLITISWGVKFIRQGLEF